MGVSFQKSDGPQECFNGWRHWSLRWYQRHQVQVKPSAVGPWSGNLVAFVDYSGIKYGDYAIINVADLYIQYNRATKHNSGVVEKRDQVTIVKSGVSPEDVSEMLAGLDMQNSTFSYTHRGDVIVIELCEQGVYGDVHYYRMSIHGQGQTSRCLHTSDSASVTSILTSQEPTPTPSKAPALALSPPTEKP